MATIFFRGDAQARAQVTKVTPADLEIGDVLVLTINRKDVSVELTETETINSGSTQEELIDRAITLLVAAVTASTVAEFNEVTASPYYNDDLTYSVALKLTGPADGKPFTVTASTANASSFSVVVTTLQAGVPPTNEIQRIVLPGPPTGGTFTLTFDGQTTGNLDYNDVEADIETALEALSNIASGDVVVTGDAPDFTVEFTQAYEGVNVPLITGSGANLTGAARVNIVTSQDGSAGINEVKQVVAVGSSLNYAIQFGATTLGYFNPTYSAAQFQTYLEAHPDIGAGNVLVTRSSTGSGSSLQARYFVTFTGALSNTNVNGFLMHAQVPIDEVSTIGDADTIGYEDSFSNGAQLAIDQQGGGTAQNEIQTVTIANAPTGGTFTLTFSGQTTAAQPYNESAANLQTDLEALSSIGAGNVLVSRAGSGTYSSPYVYTVTFQGSLAGTDVSLMTGSAASLTGGAVSVSVTQDASAGQNEQQQISLSGSPTGGDFDLTWDPGGGGETAANIAYNASAATVQAALEGLATPGPGDFSVSGAAGGPWIVEFTGTYAATNVAAITGDGDDLTGAGTQSFTVSTPNETEPTGPNWWDEPENWSGGSNPTNGDIVFLKDCDTPILYGLEDLSGVTLAELHIDLSFTGNIGLADRDENDYFQYRPKYLLQPATLLFIGEGQGAGNNLTRINSSSVQTTLLMYGSGSPQDSALPTVQWIGTHTSNVARVSKGSFGVAVAAGTTAALATLQIGYQTDRDSDAEFYVGPGCDLDNVDISGGSGVIDLNVNAMGDLVMTGGTVRIMGDNGLDQITLSGEATCFYNSTGTVGGNSNVADQATLDFSQDMRAKTVTNPIEVHGPNARVIDPFEVVAGLVIDFNYTEVQVNNSALGNHVRLTRGAPA